MVFPTVLAVLGHCAAVTHHNYAGGVGHYETPHATSDVGDTVTDNTVPYDKYSASTGRGEQSDTPLNSLRITHSGSAVKTSRWRSGRTDLSALRDGELADLADAAAEEVGASGQVLHVPLVDLVGRGSDRLVVSGLEVLRPGIEGADIMLVEKLLLLHRKPCTGGIFDDVLVAGHCAAREDLLGDEPHELQVGHRDRDAHLGPALEGITHDRLQHHPAAAGQDAVA